MADDLLQEDGLGKIILEDSSTDNILLESDTGVPDTTESGGVYLICFRRRRR